MKDLSDAHTDEPPLSGRKAIVTGGTTGIGRAIAVLLASEGVRVFICGRDPDHLADALERIREVGDGAGIAVDVARPADLKRFFDEAKAYLGGLDIAVINAAIPAGALSEMTEEEVRYAIATDFTAYLVSAHAAEQAMSADKDGPADIVLIGSMSAHVLGPGSTVYAAIKAGIAGFAEALRRELGPKGIKVSLVEPGKTGADMQYPDIPAEEQRRMIHEETMLRAEDIAVGVHYLLTQPRRAVVQQLSITPRRQASE
ncbi:MULTISPECIES: SDR family oxidoreductase [unclassified Sphingomonas]|uniref:SDR family oxidoreductase n=1 Tax=unclassified Sphingomonas TaxID=196159 RepID=UPI0006FCD1CA|nr:MULTISPECIES: SDR family oxidoreductase [unclassified Sphingomonas]KQX18638.1 short-chain dehydrogenase [Sphingomonas sp. Root1294]KQY72039.1 short-chain dehydrogenase [Sphingomonas sp. Root50]KRB94692.1 short-chain dehydrogenase [Sphingomonas sp. Root720]